MNNLSVKSQYVSMALAFIAFVIFSIGVRCGYNVVSDVYKNKRAEHRVESLQA